MINFFQFAVLGLGLGAAYALLVTGLVVIQTGSGVINFAHGAMAMSGGYTFYWASTRWLWSFTASFIFAVAVTAAMGVLSYQLVMRPLRSASPLARVVATLGLLTTIEAVALLMFSDLPRFGPRILPSTAVDIGGVFIGKDKIIMLAIAVAINAALWGIYRYTPLGLAIRAAAANESAASALGWSPHLLGSLSWGVGGALAAVAGVFLSALTPLQPEANTLIVIPVLAAGLAGGFSSFPLSLLGALTLGMCQSLVANYAQNVVGLPSALPFAVIIAFLVIRGKTLPVRGTAAISRLPDLGTGRIRWNWLLGIAGVWLVLTWTVWPIRLVDSSTTTAAWAIILLSVVVLMGYAGQIDLAPLAWGGLAALVAGILCGPHGVNLPFEIAILIGVGAAIPVGLLFGMPALRARGLNLAVVTLGLGLMVHDMIFLNPKIVRTAPDSDAFLIGAHRFFGISVDPFSQPKRYFTLVFVLFILLAVMVANLRRGRVGRRLVAVRTSERAAAALGISVFGSKLYAFAFSAALAAFGGIMYGFRSHSIDLGNDYAPILSITAAQQGVIGGVGYVAGPVLGGQLVNGGLGGWLLSTLLPGANKIWLLLIGGISVILILVAEPNGLVSLNLKAAHQARSQSKLALLRPEVLLIRAWLLLRGLVWKSSPAKREALPVVPRASVKLNPLPLEVRDLTVRYGGVVAVDNASLVVNPGEVVALIGPNGAGKTSLIDAITGFARPAGGSVLLDGSSIDGWPVHRRAQAGVARSFQGLELFEGSTVRENIQIACDRRDVKSYVSDLVRPQEALTPLAIAAIQEFELESELDSRVSEISYGHRRLVGIARAIAARPAVLLLDEPAAGLSVNESEELAHIVRRLTDDWGLGVLLVEHDMSFVMGISDRVVVLDFGRTIAQGTPEEVRGNPAVVEAYLGAPEDQPGIEEVPVGG
jgi:sulfate-transporting ATPase